MRLSRIRIKNFRILRGVDITPGPGLNLLVGDNGAGKSSLLEALGSLSRGRVRDGHPRQRVGFEQQGWKVGVEIASSAADSRLLGAGRQLEIRWMGAMALSMDGVPTTVRPLSKSLIFGELDWSSHELLDDGPLYRRRFLDWVLFHVEQNYGELWSRWRRVLQQRNQALADRQDRAAVAAWDEALSLAAEEMTEIRQRHVTSLSKEVAELMPGLLDQVEGQIVFERGWRSALTYREVLQQDWETDLKLGRTRSGPQRADLRIGSEDRLAQDLSRGQQKLVLAALLIGACRHVAAQAGSWPVIAIDDFDAELATQAQARLAALIGQYPGQSFVIQHAYDADFWAGIDHSLFHVEHGAVVPAVQ